MLGKPLEPEKQLGKSSQKAKRQVARQVRAAVFLAAGCLIKCASPCWQHMACR
jgi:hypothetical protein